MSKLQIKDLSSGSEELTSLSIEELKIQGGGVPIVPAAALVVGVFLAGYVIGTAINEALFE
jgi:hypothetical protein